MKTLWFKVKIVLIVEKQKNNWITSSWCLLSLQRTVNLHAPRFHTHIKATMMFLLGYINQLYMVFFVLNNTSKVCKSHDPILLLSQCSSRRPGSDTLWPLVYLASRFAPGFRRLRSSTLQLIDTTKEGRGFCVRTILDHELHQICLTGYGGQSNARPCSGVSMAASSWPKSTWHDASSNGILLQYSFHSDETDMLNLYCGRERQGILHQRCGEAKRQVRVVVVDPKGRLDSN